ncbi:MAG: hypothetical protein JNK78_17055 [Planctomycetes bacterium]|nr:hypothetical protein [Planctomycetota bacterium]
MSIRPFGLVCVLTFALSDASVAAQENKSRAIEHTIASLPQSLYFVVPPRQPVARKRGGLVVVLPGGDGSRDFLPWVENGLFAQTPADCAGVLVTSVKWTPEQKVIWPTDESRVEGMKYTTEEYVRAVLADAAKTQPFDPSRTVVVAWSSSGPAVYPMMATKNAPFARAYIAMSVFPKDVDFAPAKGRRFLLDQSPDDDVTGFSHVRDAFAALTKAGAVVRLSTYDGGHGWKGDALQRLRGGIEWLLSTEPAPKPVWPVPKEPKKAPAYGGKLDNLLANGGFEKGMSGWRFVEASKHLAARTVKDDVREGKQALHLKKQGGGDVDVVTQTIELPEGATTLVAKAMVKGKGASNAWIKVWLHDNADQPANKDPDLVHLTGDAEWQALEMSWPTAGCVRAVLQILMVGDGEVWVDDVVLAVVK